MHSLTRHEILSAASFSLLLFSSFPQPYPPPFPPPPPKAEAQPPFLWAGVSSSRSLLLCRRTCTWHVPSAHNELSLKSLINSRNQQVCLYCLFSLSWICQDRLGYCQGHSICCKWMKRYLVDFFRTGLQKGKTGAKPSVQWQIKSASRSQRVFLSEPSTQLSKIHIPCQRRGYYTACEGKVSWQYTYGREQTRNSGIERPRNWGVALLESTGYLHGFLVAEAELWGVRGIDAALCWSLPARGRASSHWCGWRQWGRWEQGTRALSDWCAPEASCVLRCF